MIQGMFSEHKIIELNGNKNIDHDLWFTAHSFRRELHSYKWTHQKLRTFPISNWSVHLMKLEKEEQRKQTITKTKKEIIENIFKKSI